MKRQIEQEARTVEEAITLGLASMGMDREDVSIEILEKEQKGFLGFGSKLAKVRLVSLEDVEESVVVKQPAENKVVTKKAAPSSVATQPSNNDIVKRVETFLQSVFEQMNLTVNITCEQQEKDVHVNLSGDEMGSVIGRRGETLDALQYLTTLAVNKGSEDYYKITLDTENYRSEREKTLQNLALRLAEKAKKNRRNVSLEPMNAYERKVIHSALQEDDSIHTYSVGEEPNRKIIISPKNAVKRYDGAKRTGRPYAPRNDRSE